MREHGSFKIESNNQVITVRFLDEWNRETSVRMCREFQVIANKISDKPWACIVDLTQWNLGGPEVWEPILEVNEWCTEHGQALEAVVCNTGVQKFIMKQTHEALPKTESRFFETEEAAKDWLNARDYPC